ncbi:MAG: GNAT family N-acetyltransferase [Candidatus Zixiibacteriota bacterium]|nr:MAG: GNAT family N-acetyltransferase [candidate division Zixibacteria bacterium]
MMMQIRKVTAEDKPAWVDLRTQLWPGADPERLKEDAEKLLNDANWAVFVAEHEGKTIGFIECSIRDKAPACETDRIGYIEGWFVAPEFRNQGVGRRLVQAGEQWARDKGCIEMASDTTTNFPSSPAAHKALGYQEVKRKFNYRKLL